MLRIDRSVTPTMAKAPTLGTWELDLLRSIENVVRLGHIRSVAPRPARPRGRLGRRRRRRPRRELRGRRPEEPAARPDLAAEAITLQPIRAGFPCFGAALTGYVEATRDDDAEKNRLCPPSSFGNTLHDWATMNVLGLRNTASFSSEPDIKAWTDRVALNPARVPPELRRLAASWTTPSPGCRPTCLPGWRGSPS